MLKESYGIELEAFSKGDDKEMDDWPFKNKRPRRDDLVIMKVPKEFQRVVKINSTFEDCPTLADYLRKLTPKIKLNVRDLKAKGIVRDLEDNDFENRRA